jgi:hypothetical protein
LKFYGRTNLLSLRFNQISRLLHWSLDYQYHKNPVFDVWSEICQVIYKKLWMVILHRETKRSFLLARLAASMDHVYTNSIVVIYIPQQLPVPIQVLVISSYIQQWPYLGSTCMIRLLE